MRFDLATYRRHSAKLVTDDLDLASFESRPLDADALRCLRYMHDVESHTICYLRDLLVTRAHRDPEVTTFLTLWSYEELWHGEAIAAVLAAHGEAAGPTRVAATRRSLPRRDALRPVASQLASAASSHVTAVHMAWGAVNEWTTQAGYARLAARAGHPVLTELLRRVMRQEGRHVDFYASQANERLADSRAARRLARFTLRRLWAPVGSGVMPAAEVAFVSRYLVAGPEGAAVAARVDRRIDRLPGLVGLDLLTSAVASHAGHGPDDGRPRGAGAPVATAASVDAALSASPRAARPSAA